jgi:AcrR family transcriptional regulator
MTNQFLIGRSTWSICHLPAETREKIVQAAFRTLSRKGYENTSIKDIALEAGVAQGLVHYYFKSRQALVLEVLQRACKEMELPEGLDPARATFAAFESFKAMLRDHGDTYRLYVELIGVGLHDPEVGAGVLRFVQQDRSNIEAIARQVLAQSGLASRQAPALAGAVWGAVLGIIIQHLIDPDFDAAAAVDALAAMSIAAVSKPAP